MSTEVEITRPCMACVVGLFEECHNPQELGDGWIIPCAVRFSAIEADEKPVKRKGEIGRPMLAPGEVTDPLSTGRKRAAMLLPIQTGMVCQWSGLKWAGGGVRPIVGCRGNTMAEVKKHADLPDGIDSRGERHHGPNKAVLDNSVGVNLHGICSECHHRWHELNDPHYEGERREAEFEWLPSKPYYPHDPFTKATDEDFEESEDFWATPKALRLGFFADLPPEDRLRYPTDSSTLEEDNPFEAPSNPFTENGELS